MSLPRFITTRTQWLIRASPGGRPTNAPRAPQNNLTKIHNTRNHTLWREPQAETPYVSPKHGLGHTHKAPARHPPDIDPDAHYFNELNAHISQNCNYYFEHSFSIVIQNWFTSIIYLKVFSFCPINIRSQKANLKSFEICPENLQFNFSIIGITETWLNDYNCDLYGLNGYNFVEAHRSGRSGGDLKFSW